MKVVVFGSISIRTLPLEARTRLDRVIALGAQVLIGDAPGIDTAAQVYLHERGYADVVVYHRGAEPRANVGKWPTIAVNGSYTDRDRRMCSDADYGLAVWNGYSEGTRRNIYQLAGRVGVVRA